MFLFKTTKSDIRVYLTGGCSRYVAIYIQEFKSGDVDNTRLYSARLVFT